MTAQNGRSILTTRTNVAVHTAHISASLSVAREPARPSTHMRAICSTCVAAIIFLCSCCLFTCVIFSTWERVQTLIPAAKTAALRAPWHWPS